MAFSAYSDNIQLPTVILEVLEKEGMWMDGSRSARHAEFHKLCLAIKHYNKLIISLNSCSRAGSISSQPAGISAATSVVPPGWKELG